MLNTNDSNIFEMGGIRDDDGKADEHQKGTAEQIGWVKDGEAGEGMQKGVLQRMQGDSCLGVDRVEVETEAGQNPTLVLTAIEVE